MIKEHKKKSQESVKGGFDLSKESTTHKKDSAFFNRITLFFDKYMVIIIVLTICAFFLRFYNLTFNSIWLDEAATVDFAQKSFIDIWITTTSTDPNPPLFYWIEHSMLIFGTIEFVLRFIPALLGAVTIPLFFFIGKEMIDSDTGIVAAALLTFSPVHIFYSQDARTYTTTLFFFSLAIIFYLKGMKTKKIDSWILFGLFSALSFWSHYYVAIGIGSLYIGGFLLMGKESGWEIEKFRSWVLSLVTFLIGIFPLILVMIHQFFIRTANAPNFGIQGFPIIPETIKLFLGGYDIATVTFLILFVIGAYQIWGTKKDYFLLVGFIILIAMACSTILSFYMPMLPRYLLFILPFCFTVIGASTGVLKLFIRNEYTFLILLVIIAVISMPTLFIYYTQYSKEDWRGFAGVMEPITSKGDVIIVMPAYIRMPFEYYYSNITDGTVIFGASNLKELTDLNSKLGNTTAFYIVTSDISAADPSLESVKWLNENSEFLGQDTGIFVFSSRFSQPYMS